MINGTEIRAARERAGLSQGELGALVGVTLRTIGNWERGETIPRNREAKIRQVLADQLDDRAPATLRSASDAEVLAEIARRFARDAVKRSSESDAQHAAASTQAGGSPVLEVTHEELGERRAADGRPPARVPLRKRPSARG